MKNKVNLELLQNKNFTVELKGYKIEEVNDFLDEIQSDYLYFLAEIQNLEKELALLRELNIKLTKNQEILKEQNHWLTQQQIEIAKNELSNSDVMARISQIEMSLNRVIQMLEKTPSI